MLCRFRLVFAGTFEIRDEDNMEKQTVMPSYLAGNLANRFQERLALDIADCAADLRDNHIGVRHFPKPINEFLDFSRNMRDHLHRAAEILSAPFLVQHIPVNASGGQVGKLVQILVDEAFVMPQIQIGLRPVLGHAAGVCHVYVDEFADQDMAEAVALDSKVQYPAVCNATETLLVNSRIADVFVPRMVSVYEANGVEVRGDERVCALTDAVPATAEDWDTEYGDLIISIKVVDSLAEAIDFINQHGSHHTDAIITEDIHRAAAFARSVDSADVFVNASTRFADGYRYGKGAEVGISTNKIHARGPVGMEGLMIYKYVLVGSGQVVKDYVGPGCRPFRHTPSDAEYPYRGE